MLEPGRNASLLSQYHRILAFRKEGLKKYGALVKTDIWKPPIRVTMPTIGLRSGAAITHQFGPIFVGDNPPIAGLCVTALRGMNSPKIVAEIGPGTGSLAMRLSSEFPGLEKYFGIELDPEVSGPYERVSSLDRVNESIDLIIASEVFEHMHFDQLYGDFLNGMSDRLNVGGSLVVGIPNCLAPSGMSFDFSHVQLYPWYDMYAILRLEFSRVDVYRTHYLMSPSNLFSLLPRMVVTRLIELDWCAGLAFVATKEEPKATGSSNGGQ
jgi:hypothetical protein